MLRFLLFVCCLNSVACSIPCDNEIKHELVSPDGRYTATAFIRDCGATTDFSPQVYLRRTGKLGFSKIGRRVLSPAAELERLLRRTSVKPTQTIDVDEPIRPRGQKTKARPSEEVEAFKVSTGDSGKSPAVKV